MKRNVMAVGVFIVLIFACLTFSQLSFAAESAKPITLKASVWFASNSWSGKMNQWWADELTKRTNGRVKIDFFWMDSLVKQVDMLQGLKAKMTDIGGLSSSYHPSNFPLFMTIDLLGNGSHDYAAVILANLDTQENEPNLKAELEKEGIVHLLGHTTGFGGFAMNKHYASFSDLKGKTIRTVGGVRNMYCKNLGINPIFMAYTDIYEAVSRGTVDGFECAFALSDAMKHQEVIKTVFCPNFGQYTAAGSFIRRDLFLSLPKDIQKIMLDLRRDFADYYGDAIKEDAAKIVHRWIFERGINFIGLTPEEKAFNAKAIEAANEALIKVREAQGHKAVRKVWDYYLKVLKKYTDQRAKK